MTANPINCAAALITAVFLLCPEYAPARIYRKVHRDGTIEYYNRNETASVLPVNRELSSAFDDIIGKHASQQGIDPRLVKCIIKVESDFNPDAVSVAGAMGLMQIMQDTCHYYNLDRPFDPEKNIEAGVRHFKSMMAFFGNDVPLALAAYHAGVGAVKKRMALPPIKATVDYVNSVMYLYTGERKNYSDLVARKLYRRVDKDGTIVIYSK